MPDIRSFESHYNEDKPKASIAIIKHGLRFCGIRVNPNIPSDGLRLKLNLRIPPFTF